MEVNDRCTSKGLQSLLLRLKSWGADKMLVRPIVVVSSSRAAFGLTIGLKELRTEHLTVPDLMGNEAASVLDKIIKTHITKDGTTKEEKEISDICEYVVSVLGTRPLDLTYLNSALEKTNGNLSIKTLKNLVERVVEKQSQLYCFALTTCMCEIAGEDPHKQKAFKGFVTNLHNAHLNYIWQTFGISNQKFINIIEKIQPHPFYVLLDEDQVCLGNVTIKHRCRVIRTVKSYVCLSWTITCMCIVHCNYLGVCSRLRHVNCHWSPGTSNLDGIYPPELQLKKLRNVQHH